jgi:hypothetical protein
MKEKYSPEQLPIKKKKPLYALRWQAVDFSLKNYSLLAGCCLEIH